MSFTVRIKCKHRIHRDLNRFWNKFSFIIEIYKISLTLSYAGTGKFHNNIVLNLVVIWKFDYIVLQE